MAIRGTVEVCGLSLNASPHPEGVYVSALREGARLLVGRARLILRKFQRREGKRGLITYIQVAFRFGLIST